MSESKSRSTFPLWKLGMAKVPLLDAITDLSHARQCHVPIGPHCSHTRDSGSTFDQRLGSTSAFG
jgi:hypothetical protein